MERFLGGQSQDVELQCPKLFYTKDLHGPTIVSRTNKFGMVI